jgi:1,4-alpha-glucan branching enzyme
MEVASVSERPVKREPSTRRKAAPRVSLDEATIEAVVVGSHGDPFAVLGVHEAAGGLVARAFVDGAAELEAFTLSD